MKKRQKGKEKEHNDEGEGRRNKKGRKLIGFV